jgi:Flp pilus assembly protein TadG
MGSAVAIADPPTGGATPRQSRERASGQALVELALIAMLLAVLATFAVEIGHALYAHNVMTHAARDGARVAMNSSHSIEDVAAIVSAAAHPLTPSTIDVTRADGEATVHVAYDYETFLPLVSTLWGGGPLTIHCTMVSRVEGS